MKKEYLAILVIGLIILGQAIDSLGGAATPPIGNPFQFLSAPIYSIYPLVALSMALKVLAIVTGLILILTSFKSYYLAKGLILFILCALALLYSIQQLATKSLMIPISWSLSLSFSAVILSLPALTLLLIGLGVSFKRWLSRDPYHQSTQNDIDNDQN